MSAIYDFRKYKASAWALVAANVLPLLGVLFFGWDAFAIVALYWTENVIIGAINVLKMITCRPDPKEIIAIVNKENGQVDADSRRKVLDLFQATRKDQVAVANLASKLFLVPFFIVHYGLFCAVHGVFILVFFGPDNFRSNPFDGFHDLMRSFAADRYLALSVAVLAGSHLYSFIRNYLGRGEYRRTLVIWQMAQPYARVIVLHLAILFGAFVAIAFGSNVGILALLVVGKTWLDLLFHLRERERSADALPPIMPEHILHETP